ncbi:WhiB family transcriptional regulator [Streptomyces sp. SAS_260]|uniref:WhiB family transcriptional regulator n=1 Tax=Streptomyces sp. SAS_260 TaxID=3412751 RepID=UPI00403D22D4
MEWAQRAACAHEDPELFFPLSSTGPALRQELAAKRVCLRCPVIRQCFDWAMSSGQVHGVWGGTRNGSAPNYAGGLPLWPRTSEPAGPTRQMAGGPVGGGGGAPMSLVKVVGWQCGCHE